jgi:hypothetical protein
VVGSARRVEDLRQCEGLVVVARDRPVPFLGGHDGLRDPGGLRRVFRV